MQVSLPENWALFLVIYLPLYIKATEKLEMSVLYANIKYIASSASKENFGKRRENTFQS